MQMELLDIRERDRKTCCSLTHSVEEAVPSDRVVLRTRSPGRIKRSSRLICAPARRAELLRTGAISNTWSTSRN
jgi:ABC-type nitrate/sulfonate/bicarbonate transport system ATPase subunit